MLILKILWKMILIPVWLIMATICLFTKVLLGFYSMAEGLARLVLGFIFIGSLIWYRHDIPRFIFLGVCEGILLLIMAIGVTIELLLERMTGKIGEWISDTHYLTFTFK